MGNVIHIEICKKSKVGTCKMRIGDVESAVTVYNMDKKDILDLIAEEMDNLCSKSKNQ